MSFLLSFGTTLSDDFGAIIFYRQGGALAAQPASLRVEAISRRVACAICVSLQFGSGFCNIRAVALSLSG